VISDLQNKYQDLQLSEIVFIDDGKKNIETAKNYGIQAFLFTDMKQFYKDLNIYRINI
jgi:FMN phosphatase YigB (HAD superfamily)